MINNNEIKKIATRLGWEIGETKEALKEYYQLPSIINRDEFIKICYKAKSPEERWEKIVIYLINNLNDDIEDTICSIIKFDICFHALALFNLNDIKKTNLDGPIFYNKKSFYDWSPIVDDHTAEKKSNEKVIRQLIELYSKDVGGFDNNLIAPRELAAIFLDIYINSKEDWRLHQDVLDVEEIILNILNRVGILALNIERLRGYITAVCYHPFRKSLRKSFNRDIKSVFAKTFSNKLVITQDKYWVIYVLMKKMTEEHGFGLRQSSRELAPALDTTHGTIMIRYAEMKKKAKEQNLTLEEIIAKHNLYIHIDDVLKDVLNTKN